MTKKLLKGLVKSDKMQKTVVVSVEIPTRHAIYKKLIKNTKNIKAHNDLGAKAGQHVIIEESKPFSKDVSWKVIEVVKE